MPATTPGAKAPPQTTSEPDAPVSLDEMKAGSRLPDALAGPYRLAVGFYNELVKLENGVRTFIRHELGDIVHLDAANAARLLRHGSVECTTPEQAAMPAAQGSTPLDRARVIRRQFGGVPANRGDRAPQTVFPAQPGPAGTAPVIPPPADPNAGTTPVAPEPPSA